MYIEGSRSACPIPVNIYSSRKYLFQGAIARYADTEDGGDIFGIEERIEVGSDLYGRKESGQLATSEDGQALTIEYGIGSAYMLMADAVAMIDTLQFSDENELDTVNFIMKGLQHFSPPM